MRENPENPLIGMKNRILQALARTPGSMSWRILLHRARGVKIGKGAFIGTDTIIETAQPSLVSIGDDVSICTRVTIIAHFREMTKVRIEDQAFIGPGAIILPGVVIGMGAVVTAGSVVTKSVPPRTMVQGNPAVPVAKCGVPLTMSTNLPEFYLKLKPLPAREKANYHVAMAMIPVRRPNGVEGAPRLEQHSDNPI
jgi:UDP-3-O-[3-hydroxymyristoyl] glucosamine N-acyltransferase